MRSNNGSNWLNNHNSRDLRGPFQYGLCWRGWGFIGARAKRDCVFSLPKPKIHFSFWSSMQEVLNAYIYQELGSHTITIIMQLGKGTNMAINTWWVVLSFQLWKRKHWDWSSVKWAKKCKSKGSQSLGSTHSLRFRADIQRSRSI